MGLGVAVGFDISPRDWHNELPKNLRIPRSLTVNFPPEISYLT